MQAIDIRAEGEFYEMAVRLKVVPDKVATNIRRDIGANNQCFRQVFDAFYCVLNYSVDAEVRRRAVELILRTAVDGLAKAALTIYQERQTKGTGGTSDNNKAD